MKNRTTNLPIYIEQMSQPSIIDGLMPIIKARSDELKRTIEPIIDQVAMLHLRKEDTLCNGVLVNESREEEHSALASNYLSMLGAVLGLSVKSDVATKRILDLLIREVNYAWWSEGCLFNLTEAEAGEVERFMAAYNRDEHLNLIINYEEE